MVGGDSDRTAGHIGNPFYGAVGERVVALQQENLDLVVLNGIYRALDRGAVGTNEPKPIWTWINIGAPASACVGSPSRLGALLYIGELLALLIQQKQSRRRTAPGIALTAGGFACKYQYGSAGPKTV